ncbi:hypothetical protein GCM10010193_70130 [Kitasatospora atroaurantiaca]|uniref:Uncharacterized protein n=1 Tax=Kitasatospora atroaurantiaca TaxID=285545 RepID=A0A561ENF7_9ACTN|nr:hypothetical protein [Kitasatospora atroaurantiaca]TWE17099.1 hypothetical protein FB465_2104 [Kitasatospora atroaurantiaca]
MSQSQPTGFCPVCKRPFRLRVNGTVWNHTGYGAAQVGYRTPSCPGSGKAPDIQHLTPEREQEIDELLTETDELLNGLEQAFAIRQHIAGMKAHWSLTGPDGTSPT